jgi:hypothetical protein
MAIDLFRASLLRVINGRTLFFEIEFLMYCERFTFFIQDFTRLIHNLRPPLTCRSAPGATVPPFNNPVKNSSPIFILSDITFFSKLRKNYLPSYLTSHSRSKYFTDKMHFNTYITFCKKKLLSKTHS